MDEQSGKISIPSNPYFFLLSILHPVLIFYETVSSSHISYLLPSGFFTNDLCSPIASTLFRKAVFYLPKASLIKYIPDTYSTQKAHFHSGNRQRFQGASIQRFALNLMIFPTAFQTVFVAELRHSTARTSFESIEVLKGEFV